MTPITERQWQNAITVELNGGDLLDANIEFLWQVYAQYGNFPYLRYLHVKVAAIDMLLGNLDEAYSPQVEGDMQARESTRMNILMTLRRVTLDLISSHSNRAGSYLVGKLTAQAPIANPDTLAFPRDANDPLFRGTPYDRPWPPVQAP
jgi:hypothetical protein